VRSFRTSGSLRRCEPPNPRPRCFIPLALFPKYRQAPDGCFFFAPSSKTELQSAVVAILVAMRARVVVGMAMVTMPAV
jgi:hypothetical protein